MPTKHTNITFIKTSNEVHKNKYGYEKCNYTNSHNNVTITCPIHGDFNQKAYSHLAGKGCNKCSQKSRFDLMRLSVTDFIEKSNKIHNSKYGYNDVNYTSTHTKVNICCPIHGIFSQEPASHLQGIGCPSCGVEKISILRRDTIDSFINKSNIAHSNLYEYNKCEYINSQTKVTITCKTHGDFQQRPNDHLMGHGCPVCCHHVSSHQKLIEKQLLDRNIEFTSSDRSVLNGQEIDIFLPKYNLGIEINGAYWHSEQYREPNYHLNKKIECEKNNINLLHIWDFEISNNLDIVMSRIFSYIGLNKKVYAKNTLCMMISSKEAKEFCDRNHLQHGIFSSVNYGLKIDYKIIAVMTFSKPRYDKTCQYELVRYCSEVGTNVVGGASKLFSMFLKDNKDVSIISYADRRFTSIHNNLYEKLGFTLSNTSKPSYFWLNNGHILKRIQTQKHKLKDILSNYDSNKSETQNMLDNGYRRVYDCGNLVFLKNFNK